MAVRVLATRPSILWITKTHINEPTVSQALLEVIDLLICSVSEALMFVMSQHLIEIPTADPWDLPLCSHKTEEIPKSPSISLLGSPYRNVALQTGPSSGLICTSMHLSLKAFRETWTEDSQYNHKPPLWPSLLTA
jgi:hypothetical protein